MTKPFDCRTTWKMRYLPRMVPAQLLEWRCHGSLESIVDSERRSLRSIGASTYEVAARTGILLAALVPHPAVQIFHGVSPVGTDLQRIPHAVNVGRRLVLIESVAWPPGHYETERGGKIYCDGTYIGQSVRPLIAATRHWRKVLPFSHQVSAVIVVHPASEGAISLPAVMPRELTWAFAEDAVSDIRRLLPLQHSATSRAAIAALIAATF